MLLHVCMIKTTIIINVCVGLYGIDYVFVCMCMGLLVCVVCVYGFVVVCICVG